MLNCCFISWPYVKQHKHDLVTFQWVLCFMISKAYNGFLTQILCIRPKKYSFIQNILSTFYKNHGCVSNMTRPLIVPGRHGKYIFTQESSYLQGILNGINEQDTSFLDCKYKHMMKSGAPSDKIGVVYHLSPIEFVRFTGRVYF